MIPRHITVIIDGASIEKTLLQMAAGLFFYLALRWVLGLAFDFFYPRIQAWRVRRREKRQAKFLNKRWNESPEDWLERIKNEDLKGYFYGADS